MLWNGRMATYPWLTSNFTLSLCFFADQLWTWWAEKLFSLSVESKATATLLLSRDSTVTSGVCVCLSHNPSLQTGSLPLQTCPAEQSSCPSVNRSRSWQLVGKQPKGSEKYMWGGRKGCGCHTLFEAELICIWMCLLWNGAETRVHWIHILCYLCWLRCVSSPGPACMYTCSAHYSEKRPR